MQLFVLIFFSFQTFNELDRWTKVNISFYQIHAGILNIMHNRNKTVINHQRLHRHAYFHKNDKQRFSQDILLNNFMRLDMIHSCKKQYKKDKSIYQFDLSKNVIAYIIGLKNPSSSSSQSGANLRNLAFLKIQTAHSQKSLSLNCVSKS